MPEVVWWISANDCMIIIVFRQRRQFLIGTTPMGGKPSTARMEVSWLLQSAVNAIREALKAEAVSFGSGD